MIPIKDTIRAQSFPLVNWLLIIANAVVWFFMIDMTPGEVERFVFMYGLVPAQINLFDPATLSPFFTHMFLHGGWLHFLSNIWILFIFGDNVEDRWVHSVIYSFMCWAVSRRERCRPTSARAPISPPLGRLAPLLRSWEPTSCFTRVLASLP
jgi:membrane associated rhomboid family serine protease